jgi:signal transduction histidine kinase/DNA-binding response OmpR family regulator/CHASE3 domain sensor protein
MQSSFRRNLIIGYSASLLLLLGGSVASYISINDLLRSTSMVNHTYGVIIETENIISSLKDAETGQRGYILTNDTSFLDPYKSGRANARKALDSVESLTADNPAQLADIKGLDSLITRRLSLIDLLVDEKKNGHEVSIENMVLGKTYMNLAREIVNRMKNREYELLDTRSEKMNSFAAAAPLLIIILSILAIIVTVISFTRVNADFNRRQALQKELEQKDKDIQDRLVLIQSIAEQISSGNYIVRVTDEGKDVLGSLSGSLNKMGESLDYSFNLLSQKEWLQTGIAKINEVMLGEKDVNAIAHLVLNELIEYANCKSGAFYIMNETGEQLGLAASYAVNNVKKVLMKGEGLVGEAAKSAKILELSDLGADDYTISFVEGAVKPHSIYVFPVQYDVKVKGVIELGSMHAFDENHKELFRSVAGNIGIAMNLAQNRARVEELLGETQAQSEELQVQHNELENINTELEAQAEKLQASEEELRVQQEELLQANQEMEERSRLLEEKNQAIVERNFEIQRKSEELEIATKYKSEFLANMSHELRTPLNSVLLLSRLLGENKEKNLTEEQTEYARVIQSSGQGLLSLIDEILDLSRIEAGKMNLEIELLSVQEVANEMRSLFEPIAREKKLEFSISTHPGVPTTIETDKMRLEQVLKNLLSNALKFTKQGSVKLNINYDSTNVGLVLFSVTDTGIGIEKDKLDLIFEAFQQADGSTRRKFGGTGLGLSISRQLAKLLGGDITVTSTLGGGSTFTVSLPVRKQLQKEEYSAKTYPIGNGNGNGAHTPPRSALVTGIIPANIPDDRNSIGASERTILIIEDDTAFAKALLDYTHSKGYKGIVAVRGDEGIEMARRHKPIGILLDIQLPVIDGWQVMEELKSDPQTRHIPVHVMSALEVKKESRLKGAVDFISKPFALEQMQEIFKKIEIVLNKKSKKVLIVEEDTQHAKALHYFLSNFQVNAEISGNIPGSISSLNKSEVDCVILDMEVPAKNSYNMLETIKKTPGMENLPIIIFTGKNLSKSEEARIKQYADSIVIKTAHSYQRILDEVSLFLHLVEENGNGKREKKTTKMMGSLGEVLAGKKVLVVDDDVRNIYSMSKMLEVQNMEVISAIDGKDALRQMESNKDVSVVLTDIMMPEMDGYEAIKQMRKNPLYRNLPIIAITAKAMAGDREKCIEAGASDYISKPIDADQLLSLLRVWLYDAKNAKQKQ